MSPLLFEGDGVRGWFGFLLGTESGQKLPPGFQRAHDSLQTTMTLCLILSPTSPSRVVVNFLTQRKFHSAKFQHDSAVFFPEKAR